MLFDCTTQIHNSTMFALRWLIDEHKYIWGNFHCLLRKRSIGQSIHPAIHPSDNRVFEVMMVATFDSREARAAPPGWVRGPKAMGTAKEVECNPCSLTPPTAFVWRKIKVVSLPHKTRGRRRSQRFGFSAAPELTKISCLLRSAL